MENLVKLNEFIQRFVGVGLQMFIFIVVSTAGEITAARDRRWSRADISWKWMSQVMEGLFITGTAQITGPVSPINSLDVVYPVHLSLCSDVGA